MSYGNGDYPTELRELRRLAIQGDAEAQYHLGVLYAKGLGVPQDYVQACQWFEKSAAVGYASAQFILGAAYADGQGVPMDDVQARQWYEKAAVQGHAGAQINLGNLYLNGYGVTKDYQQALYWFRLSADQCNGMAQAKLGCMYEEGQGVPQNFVLAHMWYNLGGANEKTNGAEFREFRDAVANRMTPAQIAEAQKLAREWKPGQVSDQAKVQNHPGRFTVLYGDTGESQFVISSSSNAQFATYDEAVTFARKVAGETGIQAVIFDMAEYGKSPMTGELCEVMYWVSPSGEVTRKN